MTNTGANRAVLGALLTVVACTLVIFMPYYRSWRHQHNDSQYESEIISKDEWVLNQFVIDYVELGGFVILGAGACIGMFLVWKKAVGTAARQKG
jgi:hypothetical protein